MPFTAVPYPPLARSPFPDGEGKKEAASPQKGSQPRLAALGSPFQGKGLARLLPPSTGRRENSAFPVSSFRAKARNLFRLRSSRRCEDSGISAPKPSPRGEGAPKGRIGLERYERERGRASQAGDLRQHPIHRWRGPPSPMGKAKRRRLRRIIRRDIIQIRFFLCVHK